MLRQLLLYHLLVLLTVLLSNKGKDYKQFDVLSVSGTALSKSGGSTKPDLQLSVDHAGFSIQNTVLNVSNADKITINDRLQLGSEIVKVTAKTGTALTVNRAQESTIAVAVSYTHLTLPTILLV